MSFQAQVLHVLRKDIRLARWYIAAFLLIVGLAVVSSLDWPRTAPVTLPAAPYLVTLTATIVLAAVIQLDSPSRPDAFWTTRPLRSSAVLAAKVLFAALVLIGTALVGQTIVLLALDVAVSELVPLLLVSIGFAAFVLAVAALVAAVTPDMRSFAVVFIVVLVGWYLGNTLLYAATRSRETPSPSVAGIVTLVTMIGVVAAGVVFQYHTRDARRGRWLAAALLLASVVIGALGPFTDRLQADEAATSAAHREVVFEISPNPATREPGTGVLLYLNLRPANPSDRQYTLVEPIARVLAPDRSASIATTRDQAITTRPVLAASGLQFDERQSATLSVTLSAAQLETLAAPGALLTVSAPLEIREPQLLGALPLDGVASVTRRGIRVAGARLVDAPRGSDEPGLPSGHYVQLRSISVSDPRRPRFDFPAAGPYGPFSYVLDEPGLGFTELTLARSAGTGVGLVLAGPRVWQTTAFLRPLWHRRAYGPGVPHQQPVAPPSSDARLFVFEWHRIDSVTIASASIDGVDILAAVQRSP